jgi:hypothetical protein
MRASTVGSETEERTPSKREKKQTLAEFGFPRSFRARWSGWLPIAGTAIALLAFSVASEKWLVGWWSPDLIKDTKALIIGLGALLVGVQQWRSSRSEVSLDTFWNRLSGTNDRLCEWEEVRGFAGPWKEPGRKAFVSFKRRMYVYLELDSLEYAIAKYRIGYMSPDDAYRSLNTFRQRCLASSDFCRLATDCAQNYAYDVETRVVVRRICNWRNNLNQLPEEEHPWEWRQGASE